MKVVHAVQLFDVGVNPSALPVAFRLFKLGNNDTSHGVFVLDEASLTSVMKAYSEHGVELAIDYEHQTFTAADNGKPAPAAGWFTPEARADGLWATNVRWTDAASAMLRAKEYRYFSPTFEVDDDKRITRLLPIALTNHPATKNLEPLVAAKATAKERNMSKALIVALGLDEAAVETVALSRAMKLAETERELIALTGKSNAAEALGAVTAMKVAHEQVEELTAKIADIELARASAERVALVDAAIVDKRVTRGERDDLVAFGDKLGVEALKFCLSMRKERLVQATAHQPVAIAPVSGQAAQLKAIDDELAADKNITPSVAMLRASQKNPALFDESNTVTEGA